ISKNPRSTVATTTEIYDYFRLLFAKIGIPHCPKCNIVLKRRTIDEIASLVVKDFNKKNITIASSLTNGEKIDVQKTVKELIKQGYARVIIDDKEYHLDGKITKRKSDSISVVIDRLTTSKDNISRLAESIESAVKFGKGRVEIHQNSQKNTYSIYAECIDHEYETPEEMHPRLFSFNHYSGSCPTCTGLGTIRKLDMRKIIKDWDKSIAQGTIGQYSAKRMTNPNSWRRAMVQSIGEHYGFTLDMPLKDFSPQQLDGLFYGSKGEIVKIKMIREGKRSSSEFTKTAEWEGLIPRWEKWLDEPSSSLWGSEYKQRYNQYFTEYSCSDCKGKKLKPEILSITVGNKSIYDLASISVDEFLIYLKNLKLTKREQKIADRIVNELCKRAEYLVDVGLSYLTLDRRASTLSNGEAQRIRLATQISSLLTGVIYVLDEPS
ncbi:MAG: excinuclease ABC subunit UvrA, partial [Candidatus Heimdallarchaeota archaeon]|nr:excinuclease ABC subunit UvrA [Candidatus Heimdallarchaeota archaeon]